MPPVSARLCCIKFGETNNDCRFPGVYPPKRRNSGGAGHRAPSFPFVSVLSFSPTER